MSLLLRTSLAVSGRHIIKDLSTKHGNSCQTLEKKCLLLWQQQCARCHQVSHSFKRTSQLFRHTQTPCLTSLRELCNRTGGRKLLGNNSILNYVIRRVYSTRAEVIREAAEVSKQNGQAVKATKRIPQVNEIKRLLGLAKSEKMKLAGKCCVLVCH